jgi:outer membrane scaffolding protein for murein synthesis (MipA/OmpV family)
MMPISRLPRLLALVALALSATARAEQTPLWEVGFGFAGLSMPDYRGADERQGYVLPLPYVTYHGDLVKVDRKGVYSRLFKSERVTLDFSVDAGVPVKSAENSARHGMPDLDPTFEIGPSLEICLWRNCAAGRQLMVRLPLRAVFASDFKSIESIGWVFHPHLNYDDRQLLPGGWNFGVALGPLYAGERYHDYYYQVAPAFATAARPAYDARGGYSGLRTTVAVSRRFDHFWIGGFARYDDLSGVAFEDSPLLRVRRAFMAGFGVAWILAESRTRIEAAP